MSSPVVNSEYWSGDRGRSERFPEHERPPAGGLSEDQNQGWLTIRLIPWNDPPVVRPSPELERRHHDRDDFGHLETRILDEVRIARCVRRWMEVSIPGWIRIVVEMEVPAWGSNVVSVVAVVVVSRGPHDVKAARISLADADFKREVQN